MSMKKLRELFRGGFFRKIISCDCYEHLISVETYDDDPVVRLRWWSVPGMQDLRLITRIRAAWKALRGEAISIDDFILTDETTDQLINALLEARSVVKNPRMQSDEMREEIYRSIQEIEAKYNSPIHDKVPVCKSR